MHDVKSTKSPSSPLISIPAFWPLAFAESLGAEGVAVYVKNFEFVGEEIKLHGGLRPRLATPNLLRLDLRSMALRDYGKAGAMPTLIDAPHAGHTAMIADYHQGQSLVRTLLDNGLAHVALTDWKSATPDMKDLEIDNYLADMVVAIDDLGGRVNLVGLCQGGWMAAMIAARFPEKVNALVLAGAPIDTDAGDGPIKRLAHETPLSTYQELVALGAGLMRGAMMLQGWKNMHPAQHYMQDQIDVYEHIDDPVWLAKEETFESWYESPIDLPGRWYLQAIEQIFRKTGWRRVRSSAWAGNWTCATSPARPICSPARAMTSPRRSRFSTPRNISERRRTISCGKPFPEAISACSWAPGRSPSIGLE